MSAPTLTVLIPAYNEAATMEQILEKVEAVDLEKEILVVDDCSSDDTAAIVERLFEGEEHRHLIRQPKNQGKGAALRTGVEKATGDIVIIQDADMEYDPNDYPALIQPILDGETEVVYGSRILGNNEKSYHRYYMGGRLLTIITNSLYWAGITDEPTCYKVFRRELIQSLALDEDGFGFCPEVTAQVCRLGHRIVEKPIKYCPRSIEEGKKIRWQDGIEAILILLKWRFKKLPEGGRRYEQQ
ncbi:MAG: glycosyltransferase family 2 protein [Planctomycetota bacterium]|jgi:glycosyltransferase involved in cell wall biosynthesis|nr:glycosyltransferase family 2 protein [Planctomycetota bacterium]MDP7132348.1 glycosyltransferase family 2 protein [Planctomycetota bacterium]